MASLNTLFLQHMAKKEQESGEDTDYFGSTKEFLQSQVDAHAPGKVVSDQIASQFLESNLPGQSAGSMRVVGNFLGRLYPNLVEGSIKAAGQLTNLAAGAVKASAESEVLNDPMNRKILSGNGPLLGFGYLFGKQLAGDMLGRHDETPLGRAALNEEFKGVRPVVEAAQSVIDIANETIRFSEEAGKILTPDWARERSTSWAGQFAEGIGELLVRESPALALGHVGGARIVGDMTVKGLGKVAPKLFGNTVRELTTTIGPKGVTHSLVNLAGKEGVKTLTQKIFSVAAYETSYGAVQGLYLTAADKDVFGAITTIRDSSDPVERSKAYDTISTRVAEDQFFNMLAGMTLSPLLGALSKGGARLMKKELPVIEKIMTLDKEGNAPLAVSDRVGQMIKEMAVEQDPIKKQMMIREIEFGHADEATADIGKWLLQTKDIVEEQFGLSRETGKVLVSWKNQLTNKIQILNNLIEESGVPPVEAHLEVMENLGKHIDRLDDLYKKSGLEKLDGLLSSDPATLSEGDRLLRGIFDAVEDAKSVDITNTLVKEPPAVAWLRSLSTGHQILWAQEGASSSVFEASLKNSLTDTKRAMMAERGGAAVSDIDLAERIFFDPSLPGNKAAMYDKLMKIGSKLDNPIYTKKNTLKAMANNPDKFQQYLKKIFADMRKSPTGEFEAGFMLNASRSRSTFADSILGVPDKLNPVSKGLFSYKNLWTYPVEVVQTSLVKARELADSFFLGNETSNAAKHVKSSFEVLDKLLGRFKAELDGPNVPIRFELKPGSGIGGSYNPATQLLTLTEGAPWTTGIHELAHHLEDLLPPEVVSAMNQLFDHKVAQGDMTAYGLRWVRNGAGDLSVRPVDQSDIAGSSYWSSFVEAFARYFEFNIGGPIAHSKFNPLQLDRETLAFIRATMKTLPDIADKFYGGKEHAIIAREIMSLVLDDLDRVVKMNDRRLGDITDNFNRAVQDRLPDYLKSVKAEVDDTAMKELASSLVSSTPGTPGTTGSMALPQMKILLKEIDKTLNITHDHKTIEQLANRFFHLKEQFQRHINANGDLRAFYEKIVFTGNRKVLGDLEAGFKDTKMLEDILGATNDPRQLHVTYEAFKNFVMQADELLAGAYQHSPVVWRTHDTEAFTSSIGSTIKKVLRKIPYYRDREGLTVGISKISRITDQAEFLVKKMPLLKPVYGAWERMVHDSQRFMNEVFEGSHKGMLLDEFDTPIEAYLGLGKDSLEYQAVNRLLLKGNEIGNLKMGKSATELEGLDLQELDEFGRMTRDDAFAYIKGMKGVDLEKAYSIYSGVRKTLRFILDDQRNLAKHKRLMSDSDLLKMTQKFGQLNGYIPQTRKGKFFLKASEEYFDDVSGQIKEKPLLIFSDDIAELRRMQKEDYPAGQVGLVNKKLDHGHFSTNAAAIDKIFELVAAKKGVSPEVLNSLREETANLLKSTSFLQSTMKRRNVGGWDETRVRESIYDYLQNYSRFRHKYDAMQESLTAMKYLTDRQYTEGWKWAQNLIQDMNSGADSYKPLEMMRSLVIFKTLGFNVSSALMQVTQNPVMALPRMVLDGIPRSGRLLLGAFNDVMKGKPLGKYEALALREGHLTGVTYANNINALMGNVKAEGKLSTFANKTLELSMAMMRKMEELNRQSTLLASYRGIREQLLKEIPDGATRNLDNVHQIALERAITIVKDSHLTYTKLNRPELIRGGNLMQQGGRQVYLLKQFTHGYAQLFSYMLRNGDVGQKAAVKSLLALAAFGGFNALPGFEQLSSSLQALTGKDANEHLEELMGVGGKVLGHGSSAFLPGPLGPRLNPMPRDLQSLISPAGFSILAGAGEAKKAFDNGDYLRMFWQTPFVPVAAGNIVRSIERYNIGRTTKSGKIISGTENTLPETVSGMLGLQPHNEAFLKYTRQRKRELQENESKQELFSRIRRESMMGGISVETKKEFYETQRKMLKNGKRMGFRTPLDVVRSGMVEIPE